jgi:hypothetical protein
MALSTAPADIYPHVRLVLSMVVSLSIARLLTGASRFVQHPSGKQIYWVHLGWAVFMLLHLVNFWWWEYRLAALAQWNFATFFFVVCYAILFFVLCTLLFPDQLADYANYEEYFYSRRKWFFGILATSFAFDVADTAIKGAQRFNDLGMEYPLRVVIEIALCVTAMISSNRRFQAAFVVLTLVYQVSWILRQFNTLA